MCMTLCVYVCLYCRYNIGQEQKLAQETTVLVESYTVSALFQLEHTFCVHILFITHYC